MIDKKIESDIKALTGFLELWVKFHSMYDDIIRRELISGDDEKKFLETKSLIRNRYDELKNTLEYHYMPHTRLTDPADEILKLGTIRFMSESNLRKLENDWKDSYIFLNSILERLKNRKRRLDQFNPVGVFLKRMFVKR